MVWRKTVIALMAAVALAPAVRAESPNQRLDRIIAETSAQCAALDRQLIAETEDTSAPKAGQGYGYGPVLDEDRRCHALLQSLYNASADEAEAEYRRFQRQDALAQQLSAAGASLVDQGNANDRAAQSIQPPPRVPEPPPVIFDPGYARRQTPPATCVGQVMVAGPPGQASACAGPR